MTVPSFLCAATSQFECFFLDEGAPLAGVAADGTADAGADGAATLRHVLRAMCS